MSGRACSNEVSTVRTILADNLKALLCFVAIGSGNRSDHRARHCYPKIESCCLTVLLIQSAQALKLNSWPVLSTFVV
jgi:hypothetical protein